MSTHLLRLLLGLFLIASFSIELDAQKRRDVYDGPYVFERTEKYRLMWVERGRRKKMDIPARTDSIWSVEGLPSLDLSTLSFRTDTTTVYEGVSRFAALSDVHGQYDLMCDLLRANGIIDEQGHWNYGDGHLVVLGDVFDRGQKVTEILWFLFFLEKQAEKAGGKVHLLLGNHEMMILHGNKTYIHPKYIMSSGILNRDYHALFDESSILGKWLRSKKVCITINDFVFVHGGFSKPVLEQINDLSEVNKLFADRIIPSPPDEYEEGQLLSELYFDNGPLWYRGYAKPNNFDVEQAEYILNKLNKESIIIGHTSMPQIYALHSNRIILIDSSMKFGKAGELLLFEDDLLFRANLKGNRIILQSNKSNKQNRNLFEYIVEVLGDDIRMELFFDYDSLLTTKMDEPYFDCRFKLYESEEELYELDSRVRARGNMRKGVCAVPPLKLDFKKKRLRSLGFASYDRLKLALQCLPGEENRHFLVKEKILYDLYSCIDTLALRTKLCRFDIIDDGNLSPYLGFVLEDENILSQRIDGAVVEQGIIRNEGLDRMAFLKMAFFQFLIANNDWSVAQRHNIITVKLKSIDRLVPIPYDFDYAGLINQKYIKPEAEFPPMTVEDRKLRLSAIHKDELEAVRDFYNRIRPALTTKLEAAAFLNNDDRQFISHEISTFYDILNSDKQLRKFIPITR